MYGLKRGKNGKWAVCPGSDACYQRIRQNCFGTKGPGAARQIADIIDRTPHEKYVEPFVGIGNVYRARRNPAAKEVINDVSCRQTGITRVLTCQMKDREKCDRLKKAKTTCFQSRLQVVLAHCDDRKALCYLDPPFLATKDLGNDSHLTFKHKEGVHPQELRDVTRRLKGTAMISYNDNPQAVKILCKRPFRCRRIEKQLMGRYHYEILAVKKAGAR